MAGWRKFKKWEKEIYLKGYEDGLNKKSPMFPLKVKSPQPPQFCNLPKRQIDLEIITLLEKHPVGLSAEEIWLKLGISKGTFYTAIKPCLAQEMIEKDFNKRPIIYKSTIKEYKI